MEYEVLAPLGQLGALGLIIEAGADAVYAGLYGFSSRPNGADLSLDELRRARELSARSGVKLFVAINTFVSHTQMDELMRQLEQLDNLGADAVVIADWGLLAAAHEIVKRAHLHASTLLGVYNTETVRFLQAMGVTRVVLSTNMYLNEIHRIVKEVPGVDYEIIASGGLCGNDNRQCELPHIGDASHYRVACRMAYQLRGEGVAPRAAKPLTLPQVQLGSVLGQYMSLGIRSFKIEGRTLPMDTICRRTAHLRKAVDFFLADQANFIGYNPYFNRTCAGELQ